MAHENLVEYLNGVKTSNAEKILYLDQQIDGAAATIDNLNAAIAANETASSDFQTQKDVVIADDLLIDEIISLIE